MSEKFRDKSLPVEKRVADLLGRMTLDEKIGQLIQPVGWKAYEKQDGKIVVSKEFQNLLSGSGVGSLYGVLRADPWTGVTLQTGLTPRQGAEATNAIQRFAIENTRLGIPILFVEECTHGHMAIGATVFPMAIGLASTWNPELVERMASAIALETRTQGATATFSPILDVARDPRWGRTEDTFGEDTYLCSQMGIAVVKGLQGKSLNTNHTIIATIKHFVAGGGSEGGRNAAATRMGARELYEIHLAPFEAAVKVGAQAIMSTYHEIDGVPCPANRELLTATLRDKWGFKGFVVSDLGAVRALWTSHKVAHDRIQASIMALNAGVDIDLSRDVSREYLVQAVQQGRISEEIIDQAASRILRVKFLLGLFENPYVHLNRTEVIIGCAAHRKLAREVAREQVVLLKNKNNILPLKKNIGAIAVIGPNADNIYNQLGDYTAWQHREEVVTILDGIRAKVSNSTIVHYARGCGIRDTSKADFINAIEAVKTSDIAIVVIGGSSSRYSGVIYNDVTGAVDVVATSQTSEMDCGEGVDRASLELSGVQLNLVKEIHAMGVPVVAVLINGRPLSINWISENIPAIVEAWYPGQEGGHAIADVLFGDYNPAGKLPISIPKSAAQLPVYYNSKPTGGNHHKYIDMDSDPLYSFGYGLSYTKFKYSNLKIKPEKIILTGKAIVSVDVTNIGPVAGDEVVQMYIRDEVSSVTRPVKELKGFERITLQPGETRTVKFYITPKKLCFIDIDMNYVVEPGRFKIVVGGDSVNVLTCYLEVVEETQAQK